MTVEAADIKFEGDKNGGPFVLRGTGFGSKKGILKIGETVVKTSSWNDTRIKGDLPKAVKGKIVVEPFVEQTDKG